MKVNRWINKMIHNDFFLIFILTPVYEITIFHLSYGNMNSLGVTHCWREKARYNTPKPRKYELRWSLDIIDGEEGCTRLVIIFQVFFILRCLHSVRRRIFL